VGVEPPATGVPLRARFWSLSVALLVPLLVLTGCGDDRKDADKPQPEAAPTSLAPSAEPDPSPSPSPTAAGSELPQGGRALFPAYRVVAYYGTAGTPALGVLGESDPDRIVPRLRAAAAGFATPDRKIQIAFELIATVALGGPGKDGSYSRMIDSKKIQQYVDAARRHQALVVLDIQPGRLDFLTQVKKLRPFLEQPHVGLALDPEWRMPPGQVPGKTVGQVNAAEVMAVAAYVSGIVREHNLPDKLFLLHQFRASMIPDIGSIVPQPGLAMVHHLDGFGTRSEKDATFRRLHRPNQFHLGYKLFYDEDVNLYQPHDVLAFQHVPDYISYQ
jgi:hypothetical protein